MERMQTFFAKNSVFTGWLTSLKLHGWGVHESVFTIHYRLASSLSDLISLFRVFRTRVRQPDVHLKNATTVISVSTEPHAHDI